VAGSAGPLGRIQSTIRIHLALKSRHEGSAGRCRDFTTVPAGVECMGGDTGAKNALLGGERHETASMPKFKRTPGVSAACRLFGVLRSIF
jgi:hypothetical protein